VRIGFRTLVLVLFTLTLAFAPCASFARDMGSQPPDATPARPEEPAGVEGWNFEDEDEAAVPAWDEIVRPQILDLVLFTGFVALAMVSFFRKSERLKVVVLVLSIAYLGFARGQLISVVNLFALLDWNLPIFQYSLFWYLFAGFTVLSTVVWGRLYCGRICAYGALTQLMDKVIPGKLRYEVPVAIERRASWIKYGLLGAVIVYYFVTHDNFIYRYVEPFWLFSGQASMVMWIGLAVLLVATVFVRNLYCRFLCPVGAFLGVISQVTTMFRIKRWAECKSCKICEKTCEWGAIQGPKIVRSECVRCDDCERLYMDQQKCVHWIVIRRKSEIMARQSGASAVSNALSVPSR
jgi:NosR/NirI family transcriptional regulator, nitrous oxide reductase regulator